jgi:hypothetical protein
MIAPENRKSTAWDKASQFVYKPFKIGFFIHKMFKNRSNSSKDYGLTQGGKRCIFSLLIISMLNNS